LAVVAGMKKPNDHAEPTKVERQKQDYNKPLITSQMSDLQYSILQEMFDSTYLFGL